MNVDNEAMDKAGYYPVRMLWSVKYKCLVYVVNQSKYGESTIDKVYILNNGEYIEVDELDKMKQDTTTEREDG